MSTKISNTNRMRNSKLPPLKDPVILYIDDSSESRKAKTLLKKAGISPFLANGRVGPFERKPLLLYNGGTYQGLNEIRSLLRLLKFWTKHPVSSLVFQNPK